jgi:hypothetical protein
MSPPVKGAGYATQILIVGLVVAFAAGYLVGNRGATVVTMPAPPPLPVNYDPARALASDVIRELQASEARCYQAMISELHTRLEKSDKLRRCRE